jgi:DNA-binding NtrC family response regulator
MATKVLIIDDDAGFIHVVGAIARQLGMEVRTLNDPLGATQVFSDYRPDVLMLDMIMPEKDGIDVLNEILSIGIPVQIVLTSGFGDTYLRLAESVAQYHGIKRVDILKKPFRRDELIELLKRLADEQRSDGDPR